MIANISTGNYTKGMIKYHSEKVEKKEATIFAANNLLSTNDKYIHKIFNSYSKNSRIKDKNFHVSLNFKEADFKKIDKKNQENIIKEYMNKLGFPKDHPYVVYFHKDKKHPHFHIITTKITSTGKPINDYKLFQKSTSISREIEKKYNLEIVVKNKNNRIKTAFNETKGLKKEYLAKKITLHQYLNNHIKHALNTLKVKNFEEFKSYLKEADISIYETTHKNQGLIFVFGNNTKGIAASKIDKKYVKPKLIKNFANNKKEYENLKKEKAKFISDKINFLFYKYDKISPETYVKELSRKGITVKVNSTNNIIRGFKYEFEGYSFKGQDLPKRAYTMAKINHKFNYDSLENKYNDNYLLKRHYKETKVNPLNLNFLNFLKEINKHKKLKTTITNGTLTIQLLNTSSDNKITISDYDDQIKELSNDDIIKIENELLIFKEAINLDNLENVNLETTLKDNTFSSRISGIDESYTPTSEEEVTQKKKKKKKKRKKF